MKQNRFNTLLFAGLLFLPQALIAQPPLSLQGAIELALSQDPRIEEKKAFVREAQGLLDEALGSAGMRYAADSFLALTPNVSGGFYQNGETSCSGQCMSRDDIFDLSDGFSVWAGLTFSIIKPLTTFGLLESYEEAAENNILIQQQEVELQRDRIRLDVVRAYYGYLTAKDSRLFLEGIRGQLQKALILAQEFLQTGKGDISLSDQYALESAIGLVNNYLADAAAIESIAMAGIQLLTGLTGETIELEDSHLSPVALPEQSLETWTGLALNNRPEFKQVTAGLAARRALVEASRAQTQPVLYAGIAGSLAFSPDRDRLDNPHIYDPFNHAALSPLIGMSWQWQPGAQSAQVTQAQARLDAMIQTASFARKGIPFQVQEQYTLVQSKYQSVQAMRTSAKSARRWMTATYTDFEAGFKEAEKILSAMQVYTLAYTQYLSIVNDYNNHVSKLHSVSGVYK